MAYQASGQPQMYQMNVQQSQPGGYPYPGGMYPPLSGNPPTTTLGQPVSYPPVPPGVTPGRQNQQVKLFLLNLLSFYTMTVNYAPQPQFSDPNVPQGLEYLNAVDQLIVQQKVEMMEAFTGWETNNKYSIKNSMGQNVYYAVEGKFS